MNIKGQILQELQLYLDGKIKHIPVGYSKLGYFINSFRKGRLSLIGAYTGAGKTFFVLNLVEEILKIAPSTKICIVSTEMSELDYITRLLCVRAGFYFQDFEREPEKFAPKLKEQLDNFTLHSEIQPTIVGMVNKWEEIELQVSGFDIVIIDFIQDVSVDDKYKPEDTMPILTHKLRSVMQDSHVIAISQLNNKHIEHKLETFPFAFAVEMSRIVSHAILLKRIKIKDKQTGEKVYSPFLTVNILKNRYGAEGWFPLKIYPGHRFHELTQVELVEFENINK